MMAGRSWSELLPELLTDIAERLLPCYEDLIEFRGVCRSWESAAGQPSLSRLLDYHLCCWQREKMKTMYGIFLYSLKEEEEEEDGHINYKKKIINRVILPEARKKRCLSSRGWLLTVETPDGYPHLLHPYSRRQFILPKMDTFPKFNPICNEYLHYIKKFLLSSSDPSSPDFLVIVIWGGKGKVGFCRLGDASWTVFDEWEKAAIFDITYYNGLVYAIDSTSTILACDVHGKGPYRVQLVSELPEELRLFNRMTETTYISRSGSARDGKKLLIVNKQWEYLNYDSEPEDLSDDSEPEDLSDDTDDNDENGWEDLNNDDKDESWAYNSVRFQVFEFTFDNSGGGQWERLDDLGGNRALFLGYNSTFVFEIGAETQEYIKSDCIYYTDDVFLNYSNLPKGGGDDMGIYHMHDASFETLFDLWESRSFLTPPTWVFDEPCL